MRRRLLNLLTALSLLLCVAVVGLWVRSYRGGGEVAGRMSLRGEWYPAFPPFAYTAGPSGGSASEVSLRSTDGTLYLERWEQNWPPGSSLWFARGPGWYWDTFQWSASPGRTPTRSVVRVGVSFWMLAAATSILPLVRIIRSERRRYLQRPGTCPTCGYDLRATPGRCPECGAVAGRAAG